MGIRTWTVSTTTTTTTGHSEYNKQISKMEMKLLHIVALVAGIHGIQGGPVRSSEKTTEVKDISGGQGEIMRWFNDMGEQPKEQGQQFTQRATGAIKEFKQKLAEKTSDISKKFQEQKDKVLTPRNIATLKQIKEQLQETNNQFQGNMKSLIEQINEDMKAQLKMRNEQLNDLKSKFAQNLAKAKKSIKISFPKLHELFE